METILKILRNESDLSKKYRRQNPLEYWIPHTFITDKQLLKSELTKRNFGIRDSFYTLTGRCNGIIVTLKNDSKLY